MSPKTSAEHDPTLLKRLAVRLGWHGNVIVPGEDAPHADQALIVRPIGEHVSVGLVSVDKLAGIGDLENEVVLDDVSDVYFEKEFAQAVFEEEVLKQADKNRSTIRSFIDDWLASAREDRAYIAQVLEKHKETDAHVAEVSCRAQEVSRRAQEVLARYER